VRDRTSTGFLECVLLVGQFVTQCLQTRALFKSGPLGELFNLRLERAYVRLVLAQQRLEVLGVLFLRLVYVTRALRSFFAYVASLFVIGEWGKEITGW